MKRLTQIFGIAFLAIGLVSCASKLETGGAYAPGTVTVVNGVTNVVATAAPDKAFFIVDSSFDLAYSTVDAVFKFEKDNRAMLWKISPNIKHELDKIRPQALLIAREYVDARAIYMRVPTAAGLTKLQTVLGRIQQVASAAQALIPK